MEFGKCMLLRCLEINVNRLALILSGILSIAGCATGTGSALITGQFRPAVEDHSTVRILTMMPQGAEEIAIVKASSDSGWTEQGSLNYAVEELKKQAAKLGANAVVITGRDTTSEVYSVPVYDSSPIIGSSSVEIVGGVAVWIEDEQFGLSADSQGDGKPRLTLEGLYEELDEDTVKKIETFQESMSAWKCGPYLGNNLQELLLTKGTVDGIEVGGVFLDDLEIVAAFSVQGLDMRWNWDDYAIVLSPNNLARYYDFTGARLD